MTTEPTGKQQRAGWSARQRLSLMWVMFRVALRHPLGTSIFTPNPDGKNIDVRHGS